MQAYDLPTIDIVSQNSGAVRREPIKKGKGLTFAMWQSVFLALVVYVLTGLRYYDLLTPLTDAIKGLLGI